MLNSATKNEALIYFIGGLFLTALFVITAHTITYEQAIVKGFSDAIDYMAVANAVDLNALHDLSLTHAWHRLERWPVHFLMGFIARYLDLDVWGVERFAVVICMMIALLLIFKLRARNWQKLAFYFLLLMTPYAFRQYYAAPGMLSDCVFYLAILGVAVGMWNRSWLLIAIFLCIACFVRQTGVLLLPAIAWYAYTTGMDIKSTILVIGMGLLSFLICKVLSFLVFQPVSGSYVGMHTLGIFYWIKDNPQWPELIDFVGRYVLMLLSLSPLLLLISKRNRLPWMYVAFFFLLQSQPLLGGPIVSGSNVDRLSIYGLPFLGLLILSEENFFQPGRWILFISLLFAESLLPNFSILNGIPDGRYFYLLTVLVSTVISIYIYLNRNDLERSK